MAETRKISLVLSDVDGTLVTEEKVLTQRAQAAVRALHDAFIGSRAGEESRAEARSG